MGISGNYSKTFADANIASAVDVSMNADLPHFWWDVVSVQGGNPSIYRFVPFKGKRF